MNAGSVLLLDAPERLCLISAYLILHCGWLVHCLRRLRHHRLGIVRRRPYAFRSQSQGIAELERCDASEGRSAAASLRRHHRLDDPPSGGSHCPLRRSRLGNPAAAAPVRQLCLSRALCDSASCRCLHSAASCCRRVLHRCKCRLCSIRLRPRCYACREPSPW